MADQESEAGQSEVEEDQTSQRSSKTKDITELWRRTALVIGVIALLLLAVLGTALGIFLTKTECGAPPSCENATSTYLGSAPPGTNVTYFCQAPLLFPDNSPSYTVTCKHSLQWEPKDVPSCGIYTARVCSFPDLGFTLTGRPSSRGLEIEIAIQGPPPPSLQVDIPTYDDTLCAYERTEEGSITSRAGRTQSPAPLETTGEDGKEVVRVAFESVNPWAPYEVRVRGIGTTLAVTVLQGDSTTVVFIVLSASTTTATPHAADTTSTRTTDTGTSTPGASDTTDTTTAT